MFTANAWTVFVAAFVRAVATGFDLEPDTRMAARSVHKRD
jgi:hypothetical protein